MVTLHQFIRLTCLCLVLLGSHSLCRAAEVTARLSQDTAKVGEGVTLSLRITGGHSSQPVMPEIENLIIQLSGQSQQLQTINGKTSSSLTLNYVVGSNIAGEYEVPPIEITVGAEKISTPPLKLKVFADVATQLPNGITPNSAASPQRSPAAAEDQFGFLTIELATNERKHVYVGEIAPVRIRAWLPVDSRASLTSAIQPEGKAFTLHNVTQSPEQTREEKDGKTYLVATWYGGMSATKAGTYPAALSLNATVAVRDAASPNQARRRSGPFGDPFFDSAFDQMNARYIEKQVKLASKDQKIEVRPLPKEGRPENFTGAVGEFKLEPSKLPALWQTGEPQRIIASVSGSGNFSLMKAPELNPSEVWKTYDGKDEFTPSDQASFAGTKKFQFSAVPRKGGEYEVNMEMSYFDPTAGEYKTILSPAAKMQIAGADLVETQEEPASAVISPPTKVEERLAAQKFSNKKGAPLIPLVSRREFIPLLTAALALTCIGGGLEWYKRRQNDPQRRAKLASKKAQQLALQAAATSAAAMDAMGFFTAARRAIQEHLGLLWDQAPQAITLAEVSERLPADSPVIGLFREADSYEYGRQQASAESFPKWKKSLDQALQTLNRTSR